MKGNDEMLKDSLEIRGVMKEILKQLNVRKGKLVVTKDI